MSEKTPIYATCPAGCNYETVHKNDIEQSIAAIENKVGGTETIQVVSGSEGYSLPDLNKQYTIYRSSTSTDEWGIELKLRYALSGIISEIPINPDEEHNYTDTDGNTYKLPIIPLDGDYINYIITKAEFYHCTSSLGGSNDYYRIYLKYKTKNTAWQTGTVISKLPSGVIEDYLTYKDMLVVSGASSAEVEEPFGGSIPNEIEEIQADITTIKNDIADLQKNLNEVIFEDDQFASQSYTSATKSYPLGLTELSEDTELQLELWTSANAEGTSKLACLKPYGTKRNDGVFVCNLIQYVDTDYYLTFIKAKVLTGTDNKLWLEIYAVDDRTNSGASSTSKLFKLKRITKIA